MRKIMVSIHSTANDIVTGSSSDKTNFLAWAQAGIEEQIKELKEGDGNDIITFGSPTPVQSLTNANLIDEYRILVHPVIVSEERKINNQ